MLREIVEAWQQATASGNISDAGKILPGQYTLANLAHDLPECESLPQRRVLEVLSLCLKKTECINGGSEDKESIQQLASHVAGLLSCPSPLHPVDSPALAEKALDVLKSLVVNFSALLDEKDLIRVAVYTDTHDAWTTANAASSSEDILDNSLRNDTRHRFIVSAVLEHFIRPIFSGTNSNRITSTGRKAHFGNDENQAVHDPLAGTINSKPWKTTQVHAITVFAWAVGHANKTIVSESWPLFTPVLLALMDDTETRFKQKGLVMLHSFLSKCPAHVLSDTGLGEIFEQSVFPSLLSLPSMTPEDESLQLLEPAYNAIIQLAKARFPNDVARPEKMNLLTRLLREGVLAGYWHASEYVGIVELLARQTIPIINQLGPFAVRHLKELLSMFSAIMTDPFFVSCPTCIQAAAEALSAVMLNCWPRISHVSHSGAVLRMISICWLNMQDENMRTPGNAANEKALAEVSKLAPVLHAILTAAGFVPQLYYSSLLAAEPRLAKLLGDTNVATETVGEEHDASHFSRVAVA